ncbi:hypothetical protein [Fibrella arboris]|uniref:hypothetical protein n=1 Tax=Fibrella arboris TaxID=3242486 RepID=UPI003522A6A7
MNNSFDFSKLVKQVHSQIGDKLTSKEVEELLTISEDAYYKDSPLSVGKRLIILSLEFNGLKVGQDIEEPIHYQRTFQTGVYLWVGDNLVGKSSIFKIIKLALTGSKKLSRDVESWLSQIWLEFSVGSNVYTVHIDRDKHEKFHFALYTGGRRQLILFGAEDTQLPLFDGGLGKYEEYMQGLFFRELAYYSLQWTQRDGRPGNPELLTSGASWSTYYKSIFLEAEDYGMLFIGNQAELIFQMLLGLELTYPINRLKIKRNHLVNQLGIAKAAPQIEEVPINQEQHAADQLELAQINYDLSNLEAEAKRVTTAPVTNFEQSLEEIRQRYRNALQSRGNLERELDTIDVQLISLKRKITTLTRQIDDYEVDITKKKRRINDVQELLDLGAFFNSLEVRTCPNCNHSVDKQKVIHEKDTGNCRLCEHEVDHQPIDKDAYKNQVKQLDQQRQTLFDDQYRLKVDRASVQAEIDQLKARINTIGGEINALNVEQLLTKVGDLQQRVLEEQPAPFDWAAHVNRVAELSARKAILDQKLAIPIPIVSVVESGPSAIENQIQVIELAEQILQQERDERSRSLISIFENLYLKQLHSFGLPHYERVEVKSNFKVIYFMRGQEYSFDEITAGEKLRAKLGLYIALIELDVEHQLGRHPRFLVLDSPAREEGDQIYVDGLKTTLAYIQGHFGNDLQVFVGTAQRELGTAINTDQVEIKTQKEYFF